MRDSIELLIGGSRYDRFLSYTIDSDIYEAADAFSVELVPVSGTPQIRAGDRCEIFVNGDRELTGIIDRVTRGYDASGRKLTIAGRDLMGIVVDSFCETFTTLRNNSLRMIAERLLASVPYINRKAIEYDTGAEKYDSAKPFIQIEPGSRIFEVLKDVAASRGMVFYSRADGGLVFRKPRGRGRTRYSLSIGDEQPNSSIISCEYSEDMSERYSKYTITGQQQGNDSDSLDDINVHAVVRDDQFRPDLKMAMPPNGFYKPFVAAVNDDETAPVRRGQQIMSQRRAMSETLTYRVRGHSQGMWNWAIDELVRVDDNVLDIHRDFLIYGRTFEMSRQGIFCDLRLGTPGIAAL